MTRDSWPWNDWRIQAAGVLILVAVFCLGVAATIVFAQQTQGTLTGIPFGPSIPLTCNPAYASRFNPLFYLTQTGASNPIGMNWCIANNQFAGPALTIAKGTAAMGTASISSGACATTVSVTAAGVATTDNIEADFNADPTSTTGFAPGGTGIQTIIKFPTANAVNFDVCNNTTSDITPGAVTLNWRVLR